MNKPLVSIITPAFNDEKYIGKTIESVLSQTYPFFEMIIVDDCSTDSTISVINSFKDGRIRLFKNGKNRGAAFSRNLAISKAQGDYIAFLDADDLWVPNKLEKQLDFMVKNNYSFSYCNFELINDCGEKVGTKITGPKKIGFKGLLRANYIGCLTAMYKRSIYPDLSIPDDIFKRNDYALWLLLSKKSRCFLLNETLAYYRLRQSSVSKGKNKSKLIKHHSLMFQKTLNYNKIHSIFCAYRNVLYFFYRRLRYKKKSA